MINKYTVSKNIQIALVLLKEHGIRYIVLNPGATNMAFVRGVQNDPFFTCYSVVDERSAMYFAIGLYLQTGERIAINCTSAQATRNFIPGLTEAFYKHVPILAITTSKLPHQVGQEYMQGPNQTSLPIDAVKQTFACPYITSKYDELHCSRLVNEAILEITHRTPGPVQLNLPVNDIEIGVFTESDLPKVKVINRYMYWDDWNIELENKKIMLVIGEHRRFSEEQLNLLNAFCESYDVFVYTNHLSNYHGNYSLKANLLLSSFGTSFDTYKPDILLTIGGQTGDYPLFGRLAGGHWSDFEHWRISPDGNVVDTYNKLTKIFECPEELFFKRLTTTNKSTHGYYKLWSMLEKTKGIPDNLPFSNAYIAQHIHNDIPKNSYINFAILNSLRNWNYFPLDESITCCSNVAAFGIDGCTSVLIGQSMTTDELCFLISGDLAFFYDMNALGIRHIKNNVRILLINNGCGTEFKNYSSPNHQFGEEGDLYVAAAGHNGRAKGWALDAGFKYLEANCKEEFLQNKQEFLDESDKSIIFEIFTNHIDESDALKMIIEYNKTGFSKTQDILRSVLGEKGITAIKKFLRK